MPVRFYLLYYELLSNFFTMHNEIKKAIEILNRGGLILYPTDTIWGIGCDATNSQAVRRVYDLKQRNDSKAMLILLDNEVKLPYYVDDVPELAYDLIEMSEKPLTIVYDKARNVAPELIASDGTLGIRITREEFSRNLCFRFRKALVSTSANISGEPSPGCFNDISDIIKNGVDYIVPFRQNEQGSSPPSSIIRLRSNGEIKVIRP